MDNKSFDRLESKVDKLQDSLVDIRETLTRNTTSLEYHIKRTDLLEKQVSNLPKRVLVIVSLLSGIAGLLSKII